MLEHLCKYPDNDYLIQTKKPFRLCDFIDQMPPNVTIGTTMETNCSIPAGEWSKFPAPLERAEGLRELSKYFSTMISIEPIMRFLPGEMVRMLTLNKHIYFSIGANSRENIHFPEPTIEEIEWLALALMQHAEVRLKDNLVRIIGSKKLTELREIANAN